MECSSFFISGGNLKRGRAGRLFILGHWGPPMMNLRSWMRELGRYLRRSAREEKPPVRIGLALGGGFARGIAHVGVLRAFEAHNIPISCIAGVSAGSIAAAAYASGATLAERNRRRAPCASRTSRVGP